MSDDLYQKCRDCGIEKPLTEEFWHKDRNRECGLRTACKVCVNETKHADSEKALQVTLARIEQMGLDLLDKMCQAPTVPGRRIPHIAEVAQCTINLFGGAEGFSRQVVGTYFAAKPGSQVRQRILDSVARWDMKACEMGMIERDLKHMTTEDIDRLLRERQQEEMQRALPMILEMTKQDAIPREDTKVG